VFTSPAEGKTAEVALDVIRRYERRLGDVQTLRDKGVQKQITDEVRELLRPAQPTLDGIVDSPQVEKIVSVVASTVADRTISIPRITVIPKRQVTFAFNDFDLSNLDSINVQPVEDGLRNSPITKSDGRRPARSPIMHGA
jgi:type III restriction enzyme